MGLDRAEVASLTLNYRTPAEVMAEAAPVIRAAVPDANVPTSVRSTGVPVACGVASELRSVLDGWLAEHAEGTAVVVSPCEPGAGTLPATPQVRWLTPELCKGLEFDLVVLLDPARDGDTVEAAGIEAAGIEAAGIEAAGIEAAVDRYVAMTRATQRLVVLAE